MPTESQRYREWSIASQISLRDSQSISAARFVCVGVADEPLRGCLFSNLKTKPQPPKDPKDTERTLKIQCRFLMRVSGSMSAHLVRWKIAPGARGAHQDL